MSKGSWIAGINAVASALEHDIERVHEVLLEAALEGDASHFARQDAVEQFRLSRRIVGVGLDIDRHAANSRCRRERIIAQPVLREMEKESGERKGLPGCWNLRRPCGMVQPSGPGAQL